MCVYRKADTHTYTSTLYVCTNIRDLHIYVSLIYVCTYIGAHIGAIPKDSPYAWP